jgi:hypothetical protein
MPKKEVFSSLYISFTFYMFIDESLTSPLKPVDLAFRQANA